MAFFTRKGNTVPDFQLENALTEEPEEMPSTSSAECADDKSNSNDEVPTSSEQEEQKRFDYVVDRTYGVEV